MIFMLSIHFISFILNMEKFSEDGNENQVDIEDVQTKIDKKQYEFVRDFEWTDEMEEKAKKIIDENEEVVTDKFLYLQERNWDKFYKHNTTNFFKDRHYILAEFPELRDDTRV